jgi:GH25 family lysozyme M1 (1,4-beta-N-acetylmuramidase)
MTFGIDVSAGQVGMDFKKAKAEGVDFVIVKAAGYNTGTLYVADGYHENVDAVIAAGIAGKGHYFVVGRGNPIQEADFLVSHLYKFDKAHDVIALDNEPLNSNATFWKQADALAFLTEVQKKTGISWDRLWLYCPASLVRGNGPWDQITNKPTRIWWSAYGKQPTGHTPDHTPDLQGKIARWDIHQFTDQAHVAGRSVDGNYSKHSVAELFNKQPAPAPAPAPAPKPATNPTPAPKPATSGSTVVKSAHGDGWEFNVPSTTLTVRLQRALGRRGRYHGPANGKFTVDVAKGVQLTIEKVGYSGAVDGDIEKNGCHYIQVYAQKFGSYIGPIDNKLGTFSWTGFCLGLERP